MKKGNRTATTKVNDIHITEYTRVSTLEHFHSICPAMEMELAKVCAEGDKNYGEWNWTNLGKVPIERFRRDAVKHSMRHLSLYRSGDRSERHLAKVIWGMMVLIHFDKNCKHEDGLHQ